MKKWLIHFLGGYTQEEHDEACEILYSLGEQNMVETLIYVAKGLHGCSAEEWCSQMWKVLIDKRNKK